MGTPEIANVCVQLAKTLGMTEETRSDFAMEVMRVCLFGDSPLERPVRSTPPEAEVELRGTTKKRVAAIKKAASEVDAVNPPAKLLCRAYANCTCTTCKVPVCKTNQDVYDGMGAEDFANCFTPPLPVPTRIRAIDGCVMTDCPVCEGDMTLILWGKKPERDFDDAGAGSVGGI